MEFESTSYCEYINLKDSNTGEQYSICLSTHKDGEILGVSSDYNKDWCYFMQLHSASDYSRVRFNVMEYAFQSESMEELLETLSGVLVDGFEASKLEDTEIPIIDITKFFN